MPIIGQYPINSKMSEIFEFEALITSVEAVAKNAESVANTSASAVSMMQTSVDTANSNATNALQRAIEAVDNSTAGKTIAEEASALATEALEVANGIDEKATLAVANSKEASDNSELALENSTNALTVVNNVDSKANLALSESAEAVQTASAASVNIDIALSTSNSALTNANTALAEVLTVTSSVTASNTKSDEALELAKSMDEAIASNKDNIANLFETSSDLVEGVGDLNLSLDGWRNVSFSKYDNTLELYDDPDYVLTGEEGEEVPQVLGVSEGCRTLLTQLEEAEKELIEMTIGGLITKENKLSSNEIHAEYISETDMFPLVQGEQTKLITAMLMAEYIVSKSPIPQVGLTLDDYTKQELWAIFQFGQGQNYFEIGDKMTWISPRLNTTAQIASFNKDVIDVGTGQRANVTFILNDYVQATDSEVPTAWDSSKSPWTTNSIECYASVIELQEDGSITKDLLPPDMVGLLTSTYHKSGVPSWADADNNFADVSMYFVPVTMFRGLSYTDKYTQKTGLLVYDILSSYASNVAAFFNYKTPANLYCKTGGLAANNTLTLMNSATGIPAVNGSVNYTSTGSASDFVRRIPVAFSMGRGNM